jgi:hypothetical protein
MRILATNDTIQPAAAEKACHQDRPDPPLGCNRLLALRYLGTQPRKKRQQHSEGKEIQTVAPKDSV